MTTKYDPDRHRRRSIRLKNYDYTQTGAYFVTCCVQNRSSLFGAVVKGQMLLNDAGRMVEAIWQELGEFYPGVDTDAFVVMPNHFHGIIVLTYGSAGTNIAAGQATTAEGQPATAEGQPATAEGQPATAEGQPRGVAPTLSLADVVHRFKSFTTKQYTEGVKAREWSPYNGRLWQRNYFEHIIRSECSLDSTRAYIENNPANWSHDAENANNP